MPFEGPLAIDPYRVKAKPPVVPAAAIIAFGIENSVAAAVGPPVFLFLCVPRLWGSEYTASAAVPLRAAFPRRLYD